MYTLKQSSNFPFRSDDFRSPFFPKLWVFKFFITRLRPIIAEVSRELRYPERSPNATVFIPGSPIILRDLEPNDTTPSPLGAGTFSLDVPR